MTSRGTANVLTRTTAILAGLFFVTSLVLSILAGYDRKPTSILQGSPPGPSAPARPARRRRWRRAAACSTSCRAGRSRRRPRPRRRAGRALGAGGAAVEMMSAEGAGEPAPSTLARG